MNETERKLTDKQLAAIPKIIEGKTITDGVKRAGISKVTIYEWLKEPEFKAELQRQRADIIDCALFELKASAGEASKVLRNLLDSENEHIRLKAATTIIDSVTKFKEYEEIEHRLTALEEKRCAI